MRAALLLTALSLFGCVLAPTPSQADPLPGADRIAFVELRFRPGAVAVVSVESVPGRLKPSRGGASPVPPGHVALEVTAGDALVWADAVPDPLVRRVEYVNNAGELESREERVAEAVVTVRVPAVADRQTLTFYRPAEAGRTVVARVEVSL